MERNCLCHVFSGHWEFGEDWKSARMGSTKKLASFYTPEQRKALEEYYVALESNDLGSRKENQKILDDLCITTQLTKDQIRMWLRNRKKRGEYKGKIVYGMEQVRNLEWIFTNYSNYPPSKLKRLLALDLGLSYSQVQKWFQVSFLSFFQRAKKSILS